jgi:hypothetical protein
LAGLFKIIIDFVFTTSSSLWHNGFHLHNLFVLVPQRCCCWYVFSPFRTWLTPLSPPFIYYICCSTYYLCVFICLSFFFAYTHIHTILSIVLISAITYIVFVFLKLLLWCLLWTFQNIFIFFIYEKRVVSFLYGGLPSFLIFLCM